MVSSLLGRESRIVEHRFAFESSLRRIVEPIVGRGNYSPETGALSAS